MKNSVFILILVFVVLFCGCEPDKTADVLLVPEEAAVEGSGNGSGDALSQALGDLLETEEEIGVDVEEEKSTRITGTELTKEDIRAILADDVRLRDILAVLLKEAEGADAAEPTEDLDDVLNDSEVDIAADIEVGTEIGETDAVVPEADLSEAASAEESQEDETVESPEKAPDTFDSPDIFDSPQQADETVESQEEHAPPTAAAEESSEIISEDENTTEEAGEISEEENAAEEIAPEETEDRPEYDLPEFYEDYAVLLNTFVDDRGRVKYAVLRRKRAVLLEITKQVSEIHPAQLLSWSQQEKKTFWLNVYNIMTLKVVIDEYPIQPVWYMFTYPSNSIMHIPGAWSKKYFNVMGIQYTLSEIKSEILMKRYQDPRVCFAMSFASTGGAILRNEPYYPSKLDEQLDDQVRRFLASPKGMRIDRSSKKVYISDIFNWNKADFIASYGEIKKFRERREDIRAFLNLITLEDIAGSGNYLYISEETAGFFNSKDYEIAFEQFNWHLNDQN